MFGAVVAWLRGLVALGLAVTAASTEAAVFLAVVSALDLGLGLATYVGRYWARVLLMATDAVSIVVAFVATTRGSPLPTLSTSLPHVALGILVLLALTSPRARQYTTRRASRADRWCP